MGNIAIFRQAKVGQISTENHLYNTQEIRNRHHKNNPNLNKKNTLFAFNDGKLERLEFVRDGNNQEIIDHFKQVEKELDKLAREDYKQHKLAEKQANQDKKVRTVLQSKSLKKEFGIFLGGDKKVENKEDFEQKIVKSALKILEKKGLSEKNLISIVIHYDELTPHAHINYNDYSSLHKTTGQEFGKIRSKNGLNKQELRKLNMQEFGKFQDILADTMEMGRGQKDSKQVNISKTQYYKNLADEKTEIIAINKALEKQKIRAVNNFDYLKQATAENKALIAENKELKEKIVIVNPENNVYLNTNLDENLQQLFDILGLDKITKYDVIDNKKEVFEKLLQENNVVTKNDHDFLLKQYEQVKKDYENLVKIEDEKIVDDEIKMVSKTNKYDLDIS